MADAIPTLPITVSITGHRNPANPPAVQDALHGALDDIRKTFPHTQLQALSPLAEGADRLFAKAALNLGLPIDVVLPMPQEDYEQDFPESVSEFRDLLAKARHVGTLPFVGRNNSETVANDQGARNQQYAQVGLHVATHAQILIAVWDGQDACGLGGTAQVVNVRLNGRLRGTGDSAELLTELPQASPIDQPDMGLVCWIKIRRANRSGVPDVEPPRWPIDAASVLDTHPSSIQGPGLLTLQKLDSYNHELSLFLGAQEQGKSLEQRKQHIGDLPPHAQRLYTQHKAADHLANDNMQNVRGQFRAIFWLATIMTVTFEVWAHVWPVWYMLLIYLAFIAIIGWRVHLLRRTELAERAVDWRVLSEGLRVQTFWAIAGLPDLASHHYMRRHGSTVQWVRTAMAGLLPVRPDSAPCCRNLVAKHWIEDQQLYFKKSVRRRQMIVRRLLRLSNWAYGLGVTAAFLVFLASLPAVGLIGENESPAKAWIIVALGLLPAISGLLAGYVEFAGYRDDVREHQRMHALFQRAAEVVATLHTAEEPTSTQQFQRLVRDVGIEALREQADWALLHKSHELEIPKG